jgi:hypothetical protein
MPAALFYCPDAKCKIVEDLQFCQSMDNPRRVIVFYELKAGSNEKRHDPDRRGRAPRGYGPGDAPREA